MVNTEIIKIITDYADALRRKGVIFEKIFLFGSYATGLNHKDSDIDIAVISNEFGIDRFQERALLTKIAYDIDARIEPHPVNTKVYIEEDWMSLIHEIKSKGIEIAA